MTLKNILITIGGLILITGITVGILSLLKPTTNGPQTDTPANSRVKVTDDYVFKTIDKASFSPSVDASPSTNDGWVKQSEAIASSGTIKFTKDNCSIDIISQKSPYVDTEGKDYALSKALATSIAAGDQGTLYDGAVMTLSSSQGDIEFYSALYNPTLRYATTEGKSTTETLKEPYTTLVAVRSIAIPLPSTPSTTEGGPAKEGIIPLSPSIPSFVVKYTCKKNSFNVDTAASVIKQVSIKFSAPTAPSTETSGTAK